MAAWNIPVDQVTYLDPHDFDQNIVPSQETEKRQWFLGGRQHLRQHHPGQRKRNAQRR